MCHTCYERARAGGKLWFPAEKRRERRWTIRAGNVRMLRAQGKTLTEIGAVLKLSKSEVHRLLKDPA